MFLFTELPKRKLRSHRFVVGSISNTPEYTNGELNFKSFFSGGGVIRVKLPVPSTGTGGHGFVPIHVGREGTVQTGRREGGVRTEE